MAEKVKTDAKLYVITVSCKCGKDQIFRSLEEFPKLTLCGDCKTKLKIKSKTVND